MPYNYLSVLYKHIIQVENKNVGLKVGGAQTYHCPPNKKVWGGGGWGAGHMYKCKKNQQLYKCLISMNLNENTVTLEGNEVENQILSLPGIRCPNCSTNRTLN